MMILPPAYLRILVSSGWWPANLLSQKPSWWIALNNNKKDRIQPSTLSLPHRDLVFNSKNVQTKQTVSHQGRCKGKSVEN